MCLKVEVTLVATIVKNFPHFVSSIRGEGLFSAISFIVSHKRRSLIMCNIKISSIDVQ